MPEDFSFNFYTYPGFWLAIGATLAAFWLNRGAE